MKAIFIFLSMVFLVAKANAQIPLLSDSATIKAAVSKGIPGASVSIRMRCHASEMGVEPLYVLDGVIVSKDLFKVLNLNDIECIEILKDAVAAALYGCNAASGVIIIITTKQSFIKKIKILDAENRMGIPNATIILKKKNSTGVQMIAANELGCAEYKLATANFDSVIVSSAGYQTKAISFNTFKQQKYEVLMKKEMRCLTEVVVVGYATRRIGTRTCCCLSWCRMDINKSEKSDLTIRNRSIKLFPNPVQPASSFNLAFSNLTSGFYQIRIINPSGQLMQALQKQVSSKLQTESIALSSSFIPGVYIVQVIDETKKLVQCSKLIVQ
ncbi:MAG: T9SS type A sorting domain-containing protein [Chitinophagaceae bacterium]|nr:T9SS type A sorting domain-containing protein [Chitinophagaceae bacterium]